MFGLLLLISGLAGLGFLWNLAILDVPIYFGLVHGDYPDPTRPGHLKGATVSSGILGLHVGILATCFCVSLWSLKKLREFDDL
jgi:hypothetical protein